MQVIRLTATAGPDGVLRIMVPVGAAGEYELVVSAALKGAGTAKAAKSPAKSPDAALGELGWTAGVGDDAAANLDDILFNDLGNDTKKKSDPFGGFS